MSKKGGKIDSFQVCRSAPHLLTGKPGWVELRFFAQGVEREEALQEFVDVSDVEGFCEHYSHIPDSVKKELQKVFKEYELELAVWEAMTHSKNDVSSFLELSEFLVRRYPKEKLFMKNCACCGGIALMKISDIFCDGCKVYAQKV